MYLTILIILGVIIFLTVIYSIKWVFTDKKGFEPKLSLLGSIIAFILFLSDFEDQKLYSKFLELSIKQKNNLELLSSQTIEIEKEKRFNTYINKLKKLHTILAVAKKNTELTLRYFRSSPNLITDIIYNKDNIYPLDYYDELTDPVFFGYLDDCAIENLLEIESYMHDFFAIFDYKYSNGPVPCSENIRCKPAYEFIMLEHLRYINLNICLLDCLTTNFTYEAICLAQDKCEAFSRDNRPKDPLKIFE